MKISRKKTKIAVCGLGYVGFPVALLFAKNGFTVFGVNRSEEKVKIINRGQSPIEGKEPGLKELISQVRKTKRFIATTDQTYYQQADVIIVAVETPIDLATHEPTYTALKSALSSIAQNLKKDTLIIIESTIAPGTMDNLVKPVLEKETGLLAGKDFLLAHFPERVRPGRIIENILNYNRVLGALNPESAETAQKLYRHIVKAEIATTDFATAEVVKTGENTYRDVQIAFANELALICEATGTNIWEVRKLINDCKRHDRPVRPEDMLQVYFPGTGVGGHCLPKDPWLLVYGAKGVIEPQMIPLARQINNFMPRHLVNLTKEAFQEIGKELDGAKITILGYAYAGNSDDTRNTPSDFLIEYLNRAGAHVTIHDPYVSPYRGSFIQAIKGAQAVVLATNHDQYQKLNYRKIKRLMKPKPILIDGRNIFNKTQARKNGFIYKGIGNI